MNDKQGLGLFKLTLFAISTTLASGVFSMMSDMARNGCGTFSVLIGWLIAGIGMFCLAMCFNYLSIARPDLTNGIFTYAYEGFGAYTGFNSAWGYYISSILSQVSFATLLFASLGHFFPSFGDGNNLFSIVMASVIVWLFTFLVMRGVTEAVTISVIVTIAKIVPILMFIVAILLARAFDVDVFWGNFYGEDTAQSIGTQILETTYTTVWIFTGIEGAVVISARAKSTQVSGKATELSFLFLFILYTVISILSMGILPRGDLALLPNPAMAEILGFVVGPWGKVLINVGVIISILGAMFSYTIVTADSAFAPAISQCFPKFLAKESSRKAPTSALLFSACVIQILLIMVYFMESTYQAMYTLATSAIMIPFVLSALFCLKSVAFNKDVENLYVGVKERIISVIGAVYGFWMLFATGLTNVIISAFVFAPGLIFYIWARKQNGKTLFPSKIDYGFFAVVIIALFIAIAM